MPELAGARQALEQQRHLFETLLERLPAQVVVYDSEQRYLYCNRAAIDDDATRAWIIGKTDGEYCVHRGHDPAVAEHRKERFRIAVESRDRVSWEECLVGRDGQARHHLRNMMPVFTDDGGLEYVIGYSLDIGRRKKTEGQLEKESRLLNTIINSLPGVFYMFDENERLVRWNERLQTVSGCTAEELATMAPGDLAPPERGHDFSRTIREVLSGREVQLEADLANVSGDGVPHLLSSVRLEIDGKPHVVGTGVDISRLKRAESAVRLSEANLQAIFEHSQDAFMLFDPDNRVRAFNRMAAERAEKVFDKTMAVGMSIHEFVHDEDRELFESVMRDALAGKSVRFERSIRTRSGDYWAEINYNPVWDDSEIAGIAFISRDISERKRYEAQVRHMAYYDGLTGLPNRRHLQERAAELLAVAEQRDSRLTLLYLDLNRFKYVNDTLGHDAGDELLVLVAGDLQACLRHSDTLARLGGDEFAFVLPDTSSSQTTGLLERVLALLNRPYSVQGRTVHLGGSIGVAVYPDDGRSLEELLKHADIAMYQAKAKGGGYAFYDAAVSPYSVQKLELESDLRRAVETGMLSFHYQPLLNLASGQVEDCEALVRWTRGGEIVPAQVFIALAEETELIRHLDWLALDRVIAQAGLWHGSSRPLRVSVNLSARSLGHQDLLPYIAGLLERSRLPADGLRIEVTEKAAMFHPEASLRTLAGLKDLGIKVVVDNFGSGYASLTFLRRLPADQVKIDRNLVKGIGQDSKDENLVMAAISLGHGLGLEVVAEGVETRAQLDWLKHHQCDFAQGHLVGRPVMASSI